MSDVFRDQKRVLTIASMTELGERYAYYMIQVLLIFFLINNFKISQANSEVLVGTTLGVVYISAIIGGLIADKLIGYYYAALIGIGLMIFGSFILTLSTTQHLLFLGLSLIAISSGLIKPNMSSFIGHFYNSAALPPANRDFGFSIFYIGINIGTLLATFFASILKEHYGFTGSFYSSIAIMIVIAIVNISGIFILKKYINYKKVRLNQFVLSLLIVAGYLGVIFAVLNNPGIANYAMDIASIGCVFVLFKSMNKTNYACVLAISVFFLLSIAYWSIYFQIFISILLFLDSCVSHSFLGFSIYSSQFIAFEAVCIVILSGVVGKFWLARSNAGKPISDIVKFALAFMLMGVFFLAIIALIKLFPAQQELPAGVFLVLFVIFAISELCLSVIGLSLITKYAPAGFVSLYMGIWMVTLGLGGKLGGTLGTLVEIDSHNIALSKLNMAHGLYIFTGIALLAALIALAFRKSINRTLLNIK